MNASEISQTWSYLLESKPIDQQQATALLSRAKGDKQLQATLADDLAVHRILRSLNETESADSSERFVDRCMQEIGRQEIGRQDPEVNLVPDIKTKVATKPDSIQLAKYAISKRRRNRKLLVVGMSIAAAVLVGCFVVVWQRNNEVPSGVQRSSELNSPPSLIDQEPGLGSGQLAGGNQGSAAASGNELPERTSEELPSVPEQDGASQLVGMGDGSGNAPAETAAWVEFDEAAVWEADLGADLAVPDRGLIEPGRYRLTSGNAVVQTLAQQILLVSGPAEFEITGDHKFNLQSGDFQFESQVSAGDIEGRDVRIEPSERSRFRVRVDDGGSEVLLLVGEIKLTRKIAAEQKLLAMKSDELNRVFVNNLSIDSDGPSEDELVPVVVAAGPSKYFAQMGYGEQKRTTESPNEFIAMLETLAQNSSQSPEELGQRLDEIRRQFNDSARIREVNFGFSLQSEFQNISNQQWQNMRSSLSELMNK